MKRAGFMIAAALTASLAQADSLEATLTRMDVASRTFKSLATDVKRTDYSSLFNETKTEDGKLKMLKQAKTGVVLLAEFSGADARKIHLSGHTVEYYHPKANSEEIYDTRKFTKSADLLILVGFGMSKADLLKRYTITLGGSEMVGTVRATRLDLVPKSAEEKKLVNTIQLWIPEDKGNPIQEKILSGTANKDYYLFLFSDSKINPAIPDSDFELNLPPGVKPIRP